MGNALSGGEQQILAIGHSLIANPKMLLDEPSLGLVPRIIELIIDAVETINSERGISTLIVEQNANLALKIASRGYTLETESLILKDTADRLLTNDLVKNSFMGIEAE